jgi:oligosaccharide repeat unit polymerase
MAWYREPKVSSEPWLMVYFGSILILFGVGGYIGSHLLPNAKSWQGSAGVLVPRWYIRGGMIVALLAYLVWFIKGIQQIKSLEEIFSLYLRNPFYVKEVILKTIPGITTLTQTAVAAIPLMICCNRPKRFDYLLIGIILLLAATRSFLFSERLALLELLIPVIFLKVSARQIKWKKALAYIMIFFMLVVSFFILNESRRSFVYRGGSSAGNLCKMGVVRFLGYYMTSINNCLFLAQNFDFAAPLYYTFSAVWRFPGFRGLYTEFTGIEPIYLPQILYRHGMNPEFNTITTIGSWINDFGLIGTPIVASFFGFLSGVLYRLASQNKFIAALYSVWLVGLLEFMRIYYFTNTRLFPAYVFFMSALLFAKRISKRQLRLGQWQNIKL